MTVELNRGEPLFDRLLAVQIVAGAVEPRVVTLAFRVIPGNRTTGQSQSERLFHFEVRQSFVRSTQSPTQAHNPLTHLFNPSPPQRHN
jgi:hypothetical protein